jgi:hypothetical protein
VSQVCILVTGGALNDDQVSAWQNSCRHTQAVMVDMTLAPIYALITDKDARDVLTSYFNVKFRQ